MTPHQVAQRVRRSRTGRKTDHGFMLISLLVVLALAGVSMASHTQSLAAARKHDTELELLWVGQQYRNAIESYYLATPGAKKALPVQLEDLLLDPRFPQPVRHIRKLYADPLAPEHAWAVDRLNGQIVGLHSTAPGEPQRKVDFDPGLETFNGATSYDSWRFIWVPRRLPTTSNSTGDKVPGPSLSFPSDPLPTTRQAR